MAITLTFTTAFHSSSGGLFTTPPSLAGTSSAVVTGTKVNNKQVPLGTPLAKVETTEQSYVRVGMGVGGFNNFISIAIDKNSSAPHDAPSGFSGTQTTSEWSVAGFDSYTATGTGSITIDESYYYPHAIGGESYWQRFNFKFPLPGGGYIDPAGTVLIDTSTWPGTFYTRGGSVTLDNSNAIASGLTDAFNTNLKGLTPVLQKVLYNTDTDQILTYFNIPDASSIGAFFADIIGHVQIGSNIKNFTSADNGNPVIFDGPFASQGEVGIFKTFSTRSRSAEQTPDITYPLKPFIVVDAAPHFTGRNSVDDEPGAVQVRGLARVNRTFGFEYLPDDYKLNSFTPRSFTDWVFIPEWQSGIDEISITEIVDSVAVGGVNIIDYDESIHTTNQQQFIPDVSPVYSTVADDPDDFSQWEISPSLSSPLINRMYPTTLYMPDNSGRLLVFNQGNGKYELYKINHHDKNKGYALMFADVWETPFFAARIALLLNGSLISTAWTLESDDKTFKIWAKLSGDGGATWYAPQLMATRVDDPENDVFTSFQPTWGVVESVTTGVLTFGNYKSSDMGLNWN